MEQIRNLFILLLMSTATQVVVDEMPRHIKYLTVYLAKRAE